MMKKRLSIEVWVLTPEEYAAEDIGGINDCYTTTRRTPETALKAAVDEIKANPGELADSIVKVVVFEELYESVKVSQGRFEPDQIDADIQERTSVAVECIDLTIGA